MKARLSRIPRDQTLRYLGFHGGELPDELDTSLSRCEALLLTTVRPRVVWKLFDVLPDGSFAGTDYIPAGQDIKAFLRGCGQVVLMAATLGIEAEALILRAQKRDMAEAVILDAAGSAAIEEVCDNFCADLREELAPCDLTERFSPGYGDYPLSEQRAVFRLLDITRRIGVSLSENGLMIPQKSVTALIGVSRAPLDHSPAGCLACKLRGNCSFRKEGKSCGKT